ncbi:NTF2 fold immunity protein [Roseateles sp.]|uniref:NTF2 fold immunity protein n=1 Tax=Roseateles sp. TaxID=1971397 RepID=UPI0039E98816
MRSILALLLLAPALCLAEPRAESGGGYVPPNGLVPDARTAIAIAVAIWKPIYGAKQVESQRPFKATLVQGVWHVEGSLPRGTVGGVAEARISKTDGRVVYVMHGM